MNHTIILRGNMKTLETFSSSNIDFAEAGNMHIFTPQEDFIITGLTFVAVDVSGVSMYPRISMGTNAPDFNNFVHGAESRVNGNGQYEYYTIGGNVMQIVPANSSFEAVIVSPDTNATSNLQRIDVTGYYL